MTAKELHIGIDLLLQKIDSNWNSNITPQEKDWFLNFEILKFIKQRLDRSSNRKGTGAFDTIKRLQDLSPIMKTKKLKVMYNQEEVKVKLPFDFLYYINSIGSICCECDEPINSDNYYVTEFFPLNDINLLTSVNSRYIISINIDNTDYLIFDTIDIPSNYFPQDNIESYKKQFILINAILVEFNKKNYNNIELKYDNKKGKIVIHTEKQSTTTITINGDTTEVSSFNISYNNYNLSNPLDCDIRQIDEEFKNTVHRSYLSKSKDESIIAHQREEWLIIKPPKSAILSTVSLTYFCYPQLVNLYLNSNSNLTDPVLNEVLGNVAQTLKGIISTDTYNKYVQENMLIE